MQSGPLFPSSLPPGTLVGPWRILDWRGGGGHGASYLAEGVPPHASGKGVLKLALSPWDRRFGREATLLSRLRHPCIPRFIDQGQWHAPDGLPYPYVVMEWVHGLPLYMWAQAVSPSSRQVLRVLADVARALEATHAIGGLHRDVKGDNVLVRKEDGRGFLTDFGSSTWQGADPLTEGIFPPATPNYRSPEAYRFAANVLKSPIKQYSPGRADDLFALGVTGYRLVTGQYPPLPQDPKDPESRVWDDLDGPGPRPARALNPCCCPELSALISRMLSVRPEARGSARELAEALEQAAREAGPEADAPLYPGRAPRPAEAEADSTVGMPSWRETMEPAPPCLTSREPRGGGWPWLAAGMVGSVVLGTAWMLSTMSGREAAQEQSADAGTIAVGDSVLTAPVASRHTPSAGSPIALDVPSKPLPGQSRPDAKGRCPHKDLVIINGGCWVEVARKGGACQEYSYVHKGVCYQPYYPLQSPNTSDPLESRDGG